MAKKVESIIREIFSDPVMASSVQEKMMKERMPTNPLREKIQPFMISNIMFEPVEMNIAEKKRYRYEYKVEQDGLFCRRGQVTELLIR